MHFLYDILTHLSWQLLKIAGLMSPKLRLFVNGRKGVFSYLESRIEPSDRVIWVHTASLGEFEQGLPVIRALKQAYPAHKVLVTFFSPSGYEVKKNSRDADLITYLPLDTLRNTRRFLEIVHPELALFVKYEIWPNYLKGLSERSIPSILISGRFIPEQVFFKWYGGFMRKALNRITHYFVQDERSAELLSELEFSDITVSGDTRFDRVNEILERDNSLDFMESFKGDHLCFVMGSTWPEDEALLKEFLTHAPGNLKITVAPHDIKEAHLASLKELVPGETIFYSGLGGQDPSDYRVLILDTIGMLTKVYAYADLAYVGGGFATGLHNTLEPAVFGIPVITGPQYRGFREAEDLVELGGISVVSGSEGFTKRILELVDSKQERKRQGEINMRYVAGKKGATGKIMGYIRANLKA